MAKLTDWLLDLIYPTRCVICRRRIRPGRPRLCADCQERVPLAERTKLPYIADCVSACRYEKETAEAVRRFKFGGCQAYAHAFGELVAERIYEDLWGEFDVLSWVPLAADRRRRRGYDQSKLIAQKAAARLCLPLVCTLKKRRRVAKQSMTRSASARRANILGAYTVPKPALVAGRRILLIDDIVTTGATLSECAKTLKTAGAAEVFCAVLAKTPKKS